MQTDPPEQPGQEQVAAPPLQSAGQILQRERQRQGMSEKQVADSLHITMHYVRALEADNYEKLPGHVFARGYIKSYAILLDLDPNELQVLFDEFTDQQREDEAEAVREERRVARDRNRPWIIFSVVGFIGGFAVLWAYHNFVADDEGSSNSANPAISRPEPEAERPARIDQFSPDRANSAGVTIPAPTPAATGEEDRDPADAPNALAEQSAADEEEDGGGRVISVNGSGEDTLRIAFSGESWVEVNDGEARQLYRDIREAGDVLEITGIAPFNILLGDAPFTRLVFNGDEIDVRDNIRIDNSARLTVGL